MRRLLAALGIKPFIKNPKAIIHIGLPKTGTTALQARFVEKRAALAKAGFHYPLTGCTEYLQGHHCLAWYVLKSKKLEVFRSAFRPEKFRREVELHKHMNVLVSSEEFSLLSYSYPGIRKLLRFFPDHETNVIAYVREQAQYFNSFYLELISAFIDPGPVEQFIAEMRAEPRSDYRLLFKVWSDLCAGRVVVKPYDIATLRNGDIVADFAATVNLPAKIASSEMTVRNPALNNYQAATMLHFIRDLRARNLGELPQPIHRRITEAALDILEMPELRNGEPFWPYGKEELDSLLKQYETANDEFFASQNMAGFKFSLPTRNKSSVVAFEDLAASVRTAAMDAWNEQLLSIFNTVSADTADPERAV